MSSRRTEDSYVVINKGEPLIPGSTEDWTTHPHTGDTPSDMKDTPPTMTDTPTDVPVTQRDTSKSSECHHWWTAGTLGLCAVAISILTPPYPVSSVIGRIPTWEELLAPGAPYTEKQVEVSQTLTTRAAAWQVSAEALACVGSARKGPGADGRCDPSLRQTLLLLHHTLLPFRWRVMQWALAS